MTDSPAAPWVQALVASVVQEMRAEVAGAAPTASRLAMTRAEMIGRLARVGALADVVVTAGKGSGGRPCIVIEVENPGDAWPVGGRPS